MKKVIYPILFLLFFAWSIPRVYANTMGSDMAWSCIGQDSFLVTLVIYRDCNSNSLGSGVIYFKCATSGASITSLNTNPGTPIDITPVCNTGCSKCQSTSCSFPYGIGKYTMQGIVRLNSAGTCCDIALAWEQCCRNNNITTGAASKNFYTEARLNRCQNPCDNSPTFSGSPVTILCIGLDYTFNSGIHDIDVNSTGGHADSFTYEWASPLSSAGVNIGYTGQYAYDKAIYFWGFPNDALPFPRGIHLDPQTGDIQFRPMKAEVTVMVVQVNEFRNGIQIAKLRREMEIIVMACSSNGPPSLTTPNNVRSKSVCAGTPVSFTFSTNDPNPNDTVTISWDNSISGAIWSHTNGQTKHPTATLTWTPTDAQVRTIPYTFIVTAKDNACSINLSFTQLYQITVKPKPLANITVADSGCGIIWFRAQRIFGSGPSYLWQGQSFTPMYGSEVKNKFQPGIYPYTMTMTAGGCSNTYYDTISIISDSFVSVILPNDTIFCPGSSLNITPRIFFEKGPIKYYWSNGDTNRILHIGPVTKDEIITFTVEDSNGCYSTDNIIVSVFKKPEITPANPIEICYTGNYNVKLSPVYQVFGSNNYVSSFNWHKLGDTTTLSNLPELNTKDTGLFVFSITDSIGCFTSDSFIITNSVKKPEINMNDKDLICYNNIISHTISPTYKVFGNSNFITAFKWQLSGDTSLLSDTNFLNTKDPGIYKFTITDKFGCEAIDSIKVELTVSIDTSLQVNGAVLTAAPGIWIYKWYRNDSLIYAGATNVLKATADGSYYVRLYDYYGCIDTSRTVNIKLTSISNNRLSGSIKLYPNPTTGKLMLEAGEDFKGDINLSVFSLIGREILNQTIKSNDLQTAKEIDISDQPAGTYTVIIRYQNASFHQLIIKE